MQGRKRHIVVDTLGHLIRVRVHAADIGDREAAEALVAAVMRVCPTLRKLWADQGYTGPLGEWLAEQFGCALEIVHKLADQHTFVVLPRRWVVERTLAWLGRNRRLSMDYEYWPESTQAWMYLASIRLLPNRLIPAS